MMENEELKDAVAMMHAAISQLETAQHGIVFPYLGRFNRGLKKNGVDRRTRSALMVYMFKKLNGEVDET